jgi:hypothetical protein
MKSYESETDDKNKFLVYAVTGICIVILFIASLFIERGEKLATNASDAFMIILFAYIFSTNNRARLETLKSPLALGLIFYIIVGFIYSYFSDINFIDFIYVYKSFFYMYICALFARSKIFTPDLTMLICRAALILFLTVYAFKKIVLHIPRPIVLVENNFELITLLLIYFAAFSRELKRIRWEPVVLAAIILISGSRSAIMAWAVLMAYIYRPKSPREWAIYPLLVAAACGAVFFVFQLRMETAPNASIDRVNFLKIFLSETQDWDFFKYLIGARPITPLSAEACFALKYYKNLFSFESRQVCYSVILHSFVLRAIFDHGVLGLIAVYSIVPMYMSRSGYNILEGLAVLGIHFVNGLSVSSLNSGYVVAGFAFVLLARVAPSLYKHGGAVTARNHGRRRVRPG